MKICRTTILLQVLVLGLFFSSCSLDDEFAKPSANASIKYIVKTGMENALSAIPLSNGGFAYVGSVNFEAFVLTVDKHGNEVWFNQVGGADEDVFTCAIETSDGGIVAAGTTRDSSKTTMGKGYIAKFNKEGTLLWETVFGESKSSTEYFLNLVEIEDGSIAAVGTQQSLESNRLLGFLAFVNQDGSKAISKTYKSGPWHYVANGICATPEGELLIAGIESSNSTGSLASVYYTNVMQVLPVYGIRRWQRKFDETLRQGPMRPNISCSLIPSESGYLMSYITLTKSTEAKTEVINLRADGTLQNKMQLDGIATRVSKLENGFLFIGTSQTTQNELESKYWHLLLGFNGNIEWQSTFGSVVRQQVAFAANYVDGNYSIVGDNVNAITNSRTFTFYKLDNNGQALLP